MSRKRIVIEISSDEESSPPPRMPSNNNNYRSVYDGEVAVVKRILSAKKRLNKRKKDFDYDEDCIILDSDPDKKKKKGDIGSITKSSEKKDLVVVAEHGQVACRDFPHARHLCAKYHFKSTPHHRHCVMCYCYVCDVPAPCSRWSNARDNSHCHASDKEDKWKTLREMCKLPHNLKMTR